MTAAGPPSPAATATKVADELAALGRPVWQFLRRRCAEVVVAVAVLATALAVFAIAGAAVDDRAISADRAVAQAEVLDGSTFLRTLVRFTAANGQTVVPENGVSYPRGLQVGQSVPIEYDLSDPDNARVAGRSALDQAGTLGIAVVVVWVLLGPTAWLLVRRRRRAAA